MRSCRNREMPARQYMALAVLVLGALVAAVHALPKEVSNGRGCRTAGILDTAPYRQQVPVPGEWGWTHPPPPAEASSVILLLQ
jgi:hypothetical protein